MSTNFDRSVDCRTVLDLRNTHVKKHGRALEPIFRGAVQIATCANDGNRRRLFNVVEPFHDFVDKIIVLMTYPRKKDAGRIIIPFNEGPWKKWKVYAVPSDDDGETWQYGEPNPEGSEGGNEVQMVELNDGTVMLNCRGYTGKPRRKIAMSQDGGQTWSRLRDDIQLISPACMGSVFRLSDPLGKKPKEVDACVKWLNSLSRRSARSTLK